MYERTTGLILRTRRLTETSLIVHWLTQDFGRIGTVAKGALRPKSPLRGKMDLFYLAELVFARRRKSDLHILHEVSVHRSYPELRKELNYLRQASYAAALIEQMSEPETPLPGVFDLMTGFLDALTTQPPGPRALLAFEMKLLSISGLKPNLSATGLTPGAARLLEQFAERDWPQLARFSLSEAQAREISQFFHGFLTYQVGKLPKGRAGALGFTKNVELC